MTWIKIKHFTNKRKFLFIYVTINLQASINASLHPVDNNKILEYLSNTVLLITKHMLCYIHQKIKQYVYICIQKKITNINQLGFRTSFRYAVRHISALL